MKIHAVGLTGGEAHYARYFCIDRCRFYFSSCTCVAACLVRYLRQCSAANLADIYVPSVRSLWRSFTFAHCHDSDCIKL